MRIAVLCNDRLGFPALQQLMPHKLIVAVGTSARTHETQFALKHLCQQSGVSLKEFKKNNLEAELTSWLQQYQPDVVLVKTFPFLIPASVLNIPKFGFINFHYAPLPAFRGPNPIFWMIRDGVREGGVTVHRMDENFDSGEIFMQQAVPISSEATFGMLMAELAYAGAALTGQLLQGLVNGNLEAKKQNGEKSNWYARPKPEDLFIRWKSMDVHQAKALIKAANPWNKGAAVRFRGWTFAITDASLSAFKVKEDVLPGTIVALDPSNGLLIACKDGKALKAEIIYSEEGFFAGHRLAQFGLQTGLVMED